MSLTAQVMRCPGHRLALTAIMRMLAGADNYTKDEDDDYYCAMVSPGGTEVGRGGNGIGFFAERGFIINTHLFAR